jgi:DNA-binding response OmpR family regulator
VVPLLASAVRTANQSFALIVADDTENRQEMVVSVEQLGFTIEGAEDSVAALRQAIAEAVGVDLVVVRMNQLEAAVRVVGDIRQVAKISAVPILLVASAVDAPEIGRQFRGDPRVMVVRPRGAGAFGENVDVLLTRAAGGRITEAESEVYAIEALSTLRDIAISRTPAYSVADAETALLDALQARSGGTRTLVADTLALIDSDRAQRALFDAALAATGGERVDLLDRVAASVKRWGDRAEQRHVTALLDLVLNSSGTTAEAAARVHGALNLVAPDSAKLIPIPE